MAQIKLNVNEDGGLVIKECFSGILMETEEGNKIGICMRDDTFEINVIQKDGESCWHRVNMQTCNIDKTFFATNKNKTETGTVNK